MTQRRKIHGQKISLDPMVVIDDVDRITKIYMGLLEEQYGKARYFEIDKYDLENILKNIIYNVVIQERGLI